MANKKIPEATLRRAEQMMADGKSQREAAQATGVSTATLSKKFGPSRRSKPAPSNGASAPQPEQGVGAGDRPRRDPSPRGATGRPSKTGKPTDQQLEGMVRKVAKAPAIPARLWLRCNFCADHFQTTAGPLAVELVAISHEDRDLREILEWSYSNWRRYAWAGMILSWMGVPLIHHATPAGLYGAVGPLMGMPARPVKRDRPVHSHTPPAPVTPSPAPESVPEGVEPFPSPFPNMDLNELLATADALGIDLPPDVKEAADKLMADAAAKTAPASPESYARFAEPGEPVTPELTREEQDAELAAAAAEAAEAQAAALTADPDAD
jgi:hypothetical protein